MSIVTLVSGGLDSTLMAVLAKEAGVYQRPLFIDYGQRARSKELEACRLAMRTQGLPEPQIADLAGYGKLIRSGLTDPAMHVMEDAFTPGRNLMFLLIGASYGYLVGASAVAIGLLNERTSLFPDQTATFLSSAEALLTTCLARPINILAPLSQFSKPDVVKLASAKGISGTYSCHVGGEEACGVCIACREFDFEEN